MISLFHYLLLCCSASLILASCPCVPSSVCRPSTRLGLYRRMRRVSQRGKEARIELNLELSMIDTSLSNLSVFDILKNESSVTVDWLPFSHDVVVRNRRPPMLEAINYVRRDNSLSLVATFFFDEVNMKLRSTYEITIHALYHRKCKKLISLRPPVAINVTFACEKIQGAACTDAIKVDHHPVCNVLRTFIPRIIQYDDRREGLVEIAINERRVIEQEKAKYIIVYYGVCEESYLRPIQPNCVLALRKAKRKRICLPHRNCSFNTDISFTIDALEESRYGAQVCVVLDSRFELPPLAGNQKRIAADFIMKPPSLSMLPALNTPLVKTIVGYTLLLSILVIFLLTILMYKCVIGRTKMKPKKLKNNDVWEIEESHLSVAYDQLLGSGKFGMVYLAYIAASHLPAQGPIVLDEMGRVAAKAADYSDKAARKALFDEIEGTKLVGRHVRIAALIGTVHLMESVLMVTEYCANASLKEYLNRRRRYMAELQSREIDLNGDLVNIADIDFDMVLSTYDINRICSQICAGMVYMSSHSLVHGLLCTRHILVTLDHSIKITDFGQTQKESAGHRYPTHEEMIKWTSLEVLKGECATRKSDVWSFGVVLWEVTTIGGVPYHNLAANAVQGVLEKGYRLQKPDSCSVEIYQLMRDGWHHFANQRPSFAQISERLETLIQAEDQADARFIEINTGCDYYQDDDIVDDVILLPIIEREESMEDEESTGNERRRSREATVLLSESERLLGFRD